MVATGWGDGAKAVTANKYRIYFLGDINVPELVVMDARHEYTKNEWYILKGEFYGM